MDYQTVRDLFFVEPVNVGPPPPALTGRSRARGLRDAIEPLACQAIWSKEAADRYVELGLDDWFAAYVWQRTAALGTPPTSLAVSALGVWNPDLVGPLYEKAAAVISRDDIVTTRVNAPGATVRRLLGDIDADARPVLAALRRGIDAADATARPLFSGLIADAWPDDVGAALVHACNILREHRGDSHLAVCAAAELDAAEMNILTELYCGYAARTYSATRGWSEDQLGAALQRLRDRGLISGSDLSEKGLTTRRHIEARTDAMQQTILDAIGPHLDDHIELLDEWSNALVAAGGAPPDPAKRAAG